MNDLRHRAPLALIAAGLGLAGAMKLASTKFTVEHFDHWGYPQPSRHVIGAIEVGVAASAASAIAHPEARPVAAVGTLCAMAGALATHVRSRDSAPNYVPPTVLAVCGVAVLTGR